MEKEEKKETKHKNKHEKRVFKVCQDKCVSFFMGGRLFDHPIIYTIS